MTRLAMLETRLKELEDSQGLVELSDGSFFAPKHSGLSLLRNSLRLERDLGRPPILSDFSPADQEELQCYAKWSPEASKDGALRVMVAEMARKIVKRS